MKNTTNRRQPMKALLLALCGVLCAPLCAQGGQEQYEINLQELRKPTYDIDLRELRPAPARHARKGRKPRPRKSRQSPVSTPTTGMDGTSSYTVRPGDHIFLILTRRYGLSSAETELMIPQVMRLNSIRNPYRLTVGQRLVIPLGPPGTATSSPGGEKASPAPEPQLQTPPAAAEAPSVNPELPPVAPQVSRPNPQKPPPEAKAPDVAPQAHPVEAPVPFTPPQAPPAELPAAPKKP